MGDKQFAGWIAFCLWLSFFLLAVRGNLCRARAAVRETWKTGVYTHDFLQLSDWDNDVCGVAALALKVYSMPFVNCEAWYQCVMCIFFMITSTKAMSEYIMSTIDFAPIRERADAINGKNLSEDEESSTS